MLGWRGLRHLILRGPDPGSDPFRLAFTRIHPDGSYLFANVPWQRTRGGDSVAASFPYAYNNPIGAGIVARELASGNGIYGPPPAAYAFGTLFFNYPTPGQAIGEVVQPGGPLYDPATLAALLGQPGTEPTTSPAVGSVLASQVLLGNSF